ncbi:Olfactory Receptor 2M3 [Manis pentadactyla]|nr:Olfactory Receptor 2M3 [Manis pentadactyla]
MNGHTHKEQVMITTLELAGVRRVTGSALPDGQVDGRCRQLPAETEELSVVNNYGLETFWTQKEILSLCFGLEIPSEELVRMMLKTCGDEPMIFNDLTIEFTKTWLDSEQYLHWDMMIKQCRNLILLLKNCEKLVRNILRSQDKETVAFLANTIIILLIYLDMWLYTPMYFLLSHLSLMDLMFICTTIPKMAFNYLSVRKSISVAGCEAQIFFYVSLLGEECFLLAVMAHDLYVAIFYPLQYPNLMNWKLCGFMAASSWILSSLDGIVDVAALSFSYCGSREIPQFFCDVPALLNLSCTDTYTFETLVFICCV